MPTANSAAPRQPIHVHARRARHHIRRVRSLTLSGLGLVLAVSSLFAAETIYAPVAAASAGPACSGWNSTTRPPDYIRVLRRHSGRVQRVPFRKYVVTVMGKEWPSYLPQQLIDAGAVAVKQYAWYHALGRGRVSSRGQCFDVTDGVGDQLYKPSKARVRPDHYSAVNKTWGVRLLKNGTLFMTGYRTGSKGRCGHDSTGWKLYARSAVRCARNGMDFLKILRTYYGPVSVVNGGAQATQADESAPATNATSDTTTDATTDSAPDTAPAPITDSTMTAQGGADDGVSLELTTPTVAQPSEVSQNAFTAG